MQITVVTTWFPTRAAPARGTFVARDVRAIAEGPGAPDVRVVHLVPPQDDDGTRSAELSGIPVRRVPMAPSSPLSVATAARALPGLLRGSDLVHSMAVSALLPLAPRRPRAAWVHTEHWSALTTPASLPAPVRPLVPVVARLERRPDVVTAVCAFLARPLRGVRGRRPTRVVPCIVEPGPLLPRRPRRDGTLRLVSTGALVERKDPIVAVDTVAELVGRGIDVRLRWLGEGPLRAAVAERAAGRGVAGRVELAGSRSETEVRSALGAADMFFGPTRADNFFVSAAEALVAGRPVVLGATGGQREYVTERTGRLVTAQDPVLYADAIEELDAATRDLGSPDIAATIGDAFSGARVGAAYAAVHAEALGRV